MNAIDLKRAEFRHYLEASGVMEALSYALIKLYDEFDKPSDPVAFVRQHFQRPNDEIECAVEQKKTEDLNASELLRKQTEELNLARQEIAKLRKMLDSMSANSLGNENVFNEQHEGENSYQSIFSNSNYDNTLIKKHLTEEMFKKLLDVQNDCSIIDCIAKVDALHTNSFGVIALNGSCYSKFADLFEPIIMDIHCIDGFTKYPDSEWGDLETFSKLENAEIVSIEISCSRSLAGMPFISGINEQNLESILTKVQNAIQTTRADDKEIEGEFYKISDIKENEPIFGELQTTGIGFRSIDPEQHVLWPTGRGLYVNCARTQSILINEEEHLRFISKEMNGDFGLVYKNLVELVEKFSIGLDFEWNDKFGWLTSNLETLGSGIRCTIRLKRKESNDCINDLCQKNRIKVTPIDETNMDNGPFIELSNQRSFGVSEFECVKSFYDSVKEIIETLENNETASGTSNEKVNESNASIENSNEINEKANEEQEGTGETVVVGEEGGEQLNEENSEIKTDEVEMEKNEQMITETNKDQSEQPTNEEIPSNDENATIASESNDKDENNADDLAEVEKPNEDEASNENNENNENEANSNEEIPNEPDNPNETEPSDERNDANDQQTHEAEEQTTEG